MRLDRTGLAKHLATLNFFTLRATDERANVIASFTLIEQLTEHFDARAGCFDGVTKTDDFNFFANLDNALFNTTGHNRTTTRD